MRDYFEASANFIDEIFLAKENSDQIISTKLDLTDAREATNFLSQAFPADLSGTTIDSSGIHGWVLLDQVPSQIYIFLDVLYDFNQS